MVELNFYYIEAFEAAEWNIANVDPAAFEFEPVGYEQALMNMRTYNFEVCGIER